MSFADEIKDFVSGFATVSKTLSEGRARAANAALTDARTRAIDEEIGGTQEARRVGREAAERAGNQGPHPRVAAIPEVDPVTPPSRAKAAEVRLEDREAVRDQIIAGESGGNPNALAYKRGGASGGSAPLEDMTIAEVMQMQRSMPARGHASTAAGGPQFIRSTLGEAVKYAGVDPATTKYDRATQRKLADAWLDKVAYAPLREGKLTRDQAIDRIAGQWAIVKKAGSNRGAYDGYNGNKAKLKIVQAVPLDEEDGEVRETVFAATGGLIEAPDTGPDAEHDRPEDDYDPGAFVDVDGAREFAKSGLKYIQTTFGLDKPRGVQDPAADPRLQDGIRAFAANAGAARPEEVDAVHKTVDPRGQLSDDQRQIAAWNAQYKYWEARGEPEKAMRAAGAMLMATKRAASQAGAMALAALEKGDTKTAGIAIAKAYDQNPDGSSIKIGETTPQGVKYQMVDAQGRITQEGKASMDDMIHMATGLVNGTEWLQSILKFTTSEPSAAEKRDQARSGARTAFESQLGDDDRDFISTLSDAQRTAYLKMDPRDRKEFAQRHERRQQEEAKEVRFEERMAKGAENLDRKEALDLFKFSTRYGMWEKTREQVMTAQERALAQKEREEVGRDKRFEGSQTAREKRYREIDERILKQGGARGASGPRIGAAEGRELRRNEAIDTTAAGRVKAIDDAASDETGINPTGEQQTQREAIALGSTFGRTFKETDPAKAAESREVAFTEVYNAIGQQAGFMDAEGKIDPKKPPINPSIHEGLSYAGADIVRANGIPAAQVARALNDVGKGRIKPTLVRRGDETLVSLGPNMPPVRMSEDAFLQLARVSGRHAVTLRGNETIRAPRDARGGTAATDITAPTGELSSGLPQRSRNRALWDTVWEGATRPAWVDPPTRPR